MAGLIIYLLGSLLIGGIICFSGNKVYVPFMAAVYGLFAAAVVISITGFNLKGILISAVIIALIALLVGFFVKIALFLAGGFAGALIGLFVYGAILSGINMPIWIVPAVFAAALGICCAVWSDVLISVFTAYTGASIIASPILCFALNIGRMRSFVYADGTPETFIQFGRYLNGDFISRYSIPLGILTLAIAVLGFIVQRKNKSEK